MGIIFNIQKFCINDGPGIRTTVFFKGCPLRCKWCHNPESHLCEPELLYDSEKCVGEGELNALELVGKEMSVQEVLNEVLKDKVFYDNSGGGLTLSGGEPLMQFDFAYELLKHAKQNGIHTCVETCGFAKTEDILKIAKFTDIFLYDWKVTDDELHKEYTGVSNGLLLENLKAVDSTGSNIILRCPIIPNVNDTQTHFCGIAEIANSLNNIWGIEIEPYHCLGNSKYQKLGRTESLPRFEEPTEQQVRNWIEQIQRQTKIIVKKA